MSRAPGKRNITRPARFTPEQHDRLASIASQTGLTINGFFRLCIEQSYPKDVEHLKTRLPDKEERPVGSKVTSIELKPEQDERLGRLVTASGLSRNKLLRLFAVTMDAQDVEMLQRRAA